MIRYLDRVYHSPTGCFYSWICLFLTLQLVFFTVEFVCFLLSKWLFLLLNLFVSYYPSGCFYWLFVTRVLYFFLTPAALVTYCKIYFVVSILFLTLELARTLEIISCSWTGCFYSRTYLLLLFLMFLTLDLVPHSLSCFLISNLFLIFELAGFSPQSCVVRPCFRSVELFRRPAYLRDARCELINYYY
jgi:hypothetical protein